MTTDIKEFIKQYLPETTKIDKETPEEAYLSNAGALKPLIDIFINTNYINGMSGGRLILKWGGKLITIVGD